jgi:hypothetical protein
MARIQRGALLDWPGGWMVVASVGAKPHTAGFGPCDFRAFQLSGLLRVGGILSTPWGACELVASPASCQIARLTWDGKKKAGSPGSPQSIATTLTAAKAMGESLDRLQVDFEDLP